MNLEKYTRLERRCQILANDAQRAKGGQEQILRQLKSDYSCTTLAAAKKLLRKRKAKHQREGERIDSELDAFEKRWKDKLQL